MIRTRSYHHPGIRAALVAALATAALMLVLAGEAGATNQETSGKIAFTSDRTEGPGVRNPTGDSEIFTVNPDGRGLEQLTFNRADDYAPEYSADGERITFSSDRDGGTDDADDIFIMDADGYDQRNLTRTPDADDSFSVWSPDGGQIAFTSDRDGDFEVYTMRANGYGQRNLTRNPADDSVPDWSPDGRKIAFHSDRDGGYYDIFAMRASGAGAENLTETSEANELLPEWSPNGRWLSFASDEGNEFFVLDIFKMRVDGSDRRNLTETPFAIEFFSAWSPDGTKIAFDSTRNDPFVSEEDVNEDIFTMNSDGSDETKISGVRGADDYGPSWQPGEDNNGEDDD